MSIIEEPRVASPETPALTPGEMRTPEQKKIDARTLERVKRGLALLEEKHGPGWENKINMEELWLGSCTSCVLGQVYGDYERGKRYLRIRNGSAYGFDIGDGDRYGDLQVVWEAQIEALKQTRKHQATAFVA